MTSDYLISGAHNIPIAVIPHDQFMKKLPQGFYRSGNRKIRHDPNKVNLFLGNDPNQLFQDALNKVVKVKTDEDFARMKWRLLSLPIFLNVKLRERYTEHYVVVKRTVNTWLSVVAYINPRHPVIKAQLQKQFEECEKLLGEGKNFSLEIKIGEVLKSWYASGRNHMFASYYSYGSTICVTNFTQRCSMCYNPLVWCIPVTWVLGPPYLIYRAVKCNDVLAELSGVVTLMKEGPRIMIRGPVPPLQPGTEIPPSYTATSQPPVSNAVAGPMLPSNQSAANHVQMMQAPIHSDPYAELQNTATEDDAPLITA